VAELEPNPYIKTVGALTEDLALATSDLLAEVTANPEALSNLDAARASLAISSIRQVSHQLSEVTSKISKRLEAEDAHIIFKNLPGAVFAERFAESQWRPHVIPADITQAYELTIMDDSTLAFEGQQIVFPLADRKDKAVMDLFNVFFALRRDHLDTAQLVRRAQLVGLPRSEVSIRLARQTLSERLSGLLGREVIQRSAASHTPRYWIDHNLLVHDARDGSYK
jgi:hypothetical protein